MLNISLYQNFCDSRYVIGMNHHTNDYCKNQSYTTDRPTTSAIGRGFSPRQEQWIPHALSCFTSEIKRSYLEVNWSPDGYDPHISQFMAEAFRGRRHQGAGDTPRSRLQAYNGLFGRGGGVYCHRERQTERGQSQGSLAAGLRQGSERKHRNTGISILSANPKV